MDEPTPADLRELRTFENGRQQGLKEAQARVDRWARDTLPGIMHDYATREVYADRAKLTAAGLLPASATPPPPSVQHKAFLYGPDERAAAIVETDPARPGVARLTTLERDRAGRVISATTEEVAA